MKKARIILSLLCVLAFVGVWRYYTEKQARVDSQAPVLSAESNKIEVSISAADDELISGVTAWDENDGDISDRIIIESIEKHSYGGENEFDITYVAFDEAGNVGRLTRTLIYNDYRQAHFSLSAQLRFAQNGTWSLFDYIQVDDCLDGDLTPFLVIEGSSAVQSDSDTGIYECTLSVTNSVGDTTELTVQVEIYENSYEERTFRPTIYLTDYLIYLETGDSFAPEDYLDYVSDSGTWLIDYGEMVDVYENGETVTMTEKEAYGEAGNWLNISQIEISSDVNTSVSGTYSVIYSYTSENTGYDCSATLLVVVE